MAAYYNEIDPFAAQWLRNLIAAGHIAPGDVDERSIVDVQPDDLRSYVQCHFFAGIGVWSHALRLAGWPDDRPVWTGSCPCQPFSTAGQGAGFDDERHLWPAWYYLARQHRPPVMFGEQVASPDGLKWFDLVSSDMEGAGYAVAAADLCAAGVGAPHIRQRLYFVANSDSERFDREYALLHGGEPRRKSKNCVEIAGRGEIGRGENPELPAQERFGQYGGAGLREQEAERLARPSGGSGWWGNAEWIFCADQKYRPIEPGTSPLAHGAPARVGRLRAYGNAIVPQVAQAIIEAYLSCN
jgi:DNA (cytosine-5)-methyltransferase 1